ncbi:cobalamin B12-binding domain-containing protein [Methylomagnum sp.]
MRERWDPSAFNFSDNERWRMVFDLETHFAFLGEAVRCRLPGLFTEYAAWTHVLLLTSGGDSEQFRDCLNAMSGQLKLSATGDWVAVAQGHLADALDQLNRGHPASQSYLTEDNPHKALAEGFLHDCLNLKRSHAVAKIHGAVAKGVSIPGIYLDVITPVLYELGRLWHINKITVGHEHYCTAVAQMVMSQLFPAIFDGSAKQGRLVAACVAGEPHEIGVRMVSDLFEMNGWDTVFLGADVPTESVINTLIEHDAHILATSVTLGSHLGAVSDIIQAVRASPGCAGVKILVGGAPFNVDSTLWQRLGADGWAPDGQTALAVADQWGR